METWIDITSMFYYVEKTNLFSVRQKGNPVGIQENKKTFWNTYRLWGVYSVVLVGT